MSDSSKKHKPIKPPSPAHSVKEAKGSVFERLGQKPEFSSAGAERSKTKEICLKFLNNGKCPYGSDCRFQHKRNNEDKKKESCDRRSSVSDSDLSERASAVGSDNLIERRGEGERDFSCSSEVAGDSAYRTADMKATKGGASSSKDTLSSSGTDDEGGSSSTVTSVRDTGSAAVAQERKYGIPSVVEKKTSQSELSGKHKPSSQKLDSKSNNDLKRRNPQGGMDHETKLSQKSSKRPEGSPADECSKSSNSRPDVKRLQVSKSQKITDSPDSRGGQQALKVKHRANLRAKCDTDTQRGRPGSGGRRSDHLSQQRHSSKDSSFGGSESFRDHRKRASNEASSAHRETVSSAVSPSPSPTKQTQRQQPPIMKQGSQKYDRKRRRSRSQSPRQSLERVPMASGGGSGSKKHVDLLTSRHHSKKSTRQLDAADRRTVRREDHRQSSDNASLPSLLDIDIMSPNLGLPARRPVRARPRDDFTGDRSRLMRDYSGNSSIDFQVNFRRGEDRLRRKKPMHSRRWPRADNFSEGDVRGIGRRSRRSISPESRRGLVEDSPLKTKEEAKQSVRRSVSKSSDTSSSPTTSVFDEKREQLSKLSSPPAAETEECIDGGSPSSRTKRRRSGSEGVDKREHRRRSSASKTTKSSATSDAKSDTSQRASFVQDVSPKRLVVERQQHFDSSVQLNSETNNSPRKSRSRSIEGKPPQRFINPPRGERLDARRPKLEISVSKDRRKPEHGSDVRRKHEVDKIPQAPDVSKSKGTEIKSKHESRHHVSSKTQHSRSPPRHKTRNHNDSDSSTKCEKHSSHEKAKVQSVEVLPDTTSDRASDILQKSSEVTAEQDDKLFQADALQVDWGSLLQQSRSSDKIDQRRDRYSAKTVIRRLGVSTNYCGQHLLQEAVNFCKTEGECETGMLDELGAMHAAKFRENSIKRSLLLLTGRHTGALCARVDLEARQLLCRQSVKLHDSSISPEVGIPSNKDLQRKSIDLFLQRSDTNTLV